MGVKSIICRIALAPKTTSPSFNEVLQFVIETVNFIVTRPLKQDIFERICEDMVAEQISLLFYSDSRWFSHVNGLKTTIRVNSEIIKRQSIINVFLNAFMYLGTSKDKVYGK